MPELIETIDGKDYYYIKDIAADYNVSTTTIDRYRKQGKLKNISQAKKNDYIHQNHPIRFNGKLYPSKSEASRAEGVSRGVVDYHQKLGITEYIKSGRHQNITFLGNRYATPKVAAKENNCSIQTVYNYIRKQKETDK